MFVYVFLAQIGVVHKVAKRMNGLGTVWYTVSRVQDVVGKSDYATRMLPEPSCVNLMIDYAASAFYLSIYFAFV